MHGQEGGFFAFHVVVDQMASIHAAICVETGAKEPGEKLPGGVDHAAAIRPQERAGKV